MPGVTHKTRYQTPWSLHKRLDLALALAYALDDYDNDGGVKDNGGGRADPHIQIPTAGVATKCCRCCCCPNIILFNLHNIIYNVYYIVYAV